MSCRSSKFLAFSQASADFDLGLERTGGFETVAVCDNNAYCRHVLAKQFPGAKQYDDIRELDATRLARDGVRPNAICGGFPCQDISYAGPGLGLSGERSGLWFEYARLIGELGPEVAVVENVSALLDRGMGEVLGTLSDLGYDAEWDTVTACSVGYPHMRQRVFIVAYSHSFDGRERLRHSLARAFRTLQAGHGFEGARARQRARLANPSALYGGADGVPFGMERNRAHGNSIVPEIPELIGNAILQSRRAA